MERMLEKRHIQVAEPRQQPGLVVIFVYIPVLW
jgi:hypothetical protein